MIDNIELSNPPAQSSITPHRCGFVINGEPTFDECWSAWKQLEEHEGRSRWRRGDLLNYTEKQPWGKRYAKAIEETGREYQTLANDKYLAAKIDFSRRREKLSFGHHLEVAPYKPHEQDTVLEQAEKLHLSVKQLREQKESLLPKKGVKQDQWWQLGRHLLYCGHSATTIFLERCKETAASFAFADPPYNAGVDEWDNDFVWQHDYLSEIAPIVAVTPGISAIKDFMMMTEMPYKWSMSYWIDNGMTRGDVGFGSWIYVAIFAEGSIYRNAQDLARIDEEDMGRISITGGDNDPLKHKGRKPIEMMRHIIKLFTQQDQTVVDPFLGTGTTLIASEELGRACLGAEINPEYCESIIRRWERRTEQEAVLV